MEPVGPSRRAGRRRPQATFRRRRIAAAVLLIAVLMIGWILVRRSGSELRPPTSTESAAPTAAIFKVEAASWNLPVDLSRSVAVSHEGRILLAGGLTDNNKTVNTTFELDPQSGQITAKGGMSEGVHDAAGATIGDRSFVFGGGAASVSATVQEATTNATGQRRGALPSPRADLVAAAVKGLVVLAGGYDGKKQLAEVLTTTDGARFETVTQLPEPVRYPAVVVHEDKVFLLGGETATSDSTAIQVIDPSARTATITARMPKGISHATAVELGGAVYLLGGRVNGHATDAVQRVDLSSGNTSDVGRLPVALSDMAVTTFGDAAYLLGGENDAGKPVATVAVAHLVTQPVPASSSAAATPFDGQLLIADRGNNRLLLVDQNKNVHWTFPSPTAPAPPQGFYFPDDAFFAKHGTAIITNEEQQHTIIEIAYPSGQVIASYGHPGHPGAASGYLDQPDDAYLLADGRVTVADAKNCRILFLNADFTYHSAIGTKRTCHHDLPNDVAYPNGDTPLANGNILVSEINGSYVDELTPTGGVVWSVKLPLAYPSDPQQIGPDLYLIADYAKPGGIYEFTREGQITYTYRFDSGEQMLDHPSLVEQLPTGLLCVNDDYRHRVVIIEPNTKRIVWQYGQTDTAGTGPNELNTPDGFDLLAPDNSTPTHPHTG